MDTPQAKHWETVYTTRAPDAVSWYRPHLETSLDLIGKATGGRPASVIDVGGGESTLVDDLLARGWEDLTILDISATALEVTRQRLGPAAAKVAWIAADVTQVELSAHRYDVWHDRAVFHFLADASDRRAYVERVLHAVRPGGHVIIGAFGPDGPAKCSGLEVVRYDRDGLHGEFGQGFRLVESLAEVHVTPWGSPQQFVYCYCRLEA